LLILLLAFYLATSDPGLPSANSSVKEQCCPPHQWYWQEIVDQDGNKQGERLVCKICGPFSRSIDGSIE
jgi:hypothetical protein